MPVSTLQLRVIERVLEMGSGYVLDFTDRTFSAFFQEHGVNIDAPEYKVDGQSKAKRLRVFLRNAPDVLAGTVLAALLEHRLAEKPIEQASDVDAYREIVRSLGVGDARGKSRGNGREGSEAELLRRVFDPAILERLPLDHALIQILRARMNEAQVCIEVGAYLSAVILSGSVLEGLCLGFGSRHAERLNRAFQDRFNKSAPKFHEWTTSQWIDVLTTLRDLSPNVSKFGHALRDFRNYVHPAEQLAHAFSPDAHTARIGFQVVVAAMEDLAAAESALAVQSH